MELFILVFTWFNRCSSRATEDFQVGCGCGFVFLGWHGGGEEEVGRVVWDLLGSNSWGRQRGFELRRVQTQLPFMLTCGVLCCAEVESLRFGVLIGIVCSYSYSY